MELSSQKTKILMTETKAYVGKNEFLQLKNDRKFQLVLIDNKKLIFTSSTSVYS